ncbi:MAG: maleylpyruvate isomerase family mycothiol-dependent enzyme [Nocardioides sp.]
MPTRLTRALHLGGLRAATTAFADAVAQAGPAADVPTCPGWTMRDLVAHQGMVHRWAAAQLRGERVEESAFEEEGRRAPDLVAWLKEGAGEVEATVTAADDDTDALVFLADAPPPREFWARRQCHETTIHAVDALSAVLARHPTSGDTRIDPVIAVDGIDELLGGFLPRPRSRLRTEEPLTLIVAPDDAPDWWQVELGPRPPLTTRRSGRAGRGDVLLTAPATALYLALWNRSDELDEQDESGLIARWRDRAVVRWS